MANSKDYPEKLRPYVFLDVEFAGVTGREHYGTCPFCGKSRKFYVNQDTGQFSCKVGSCGVEGNVFKFLRLWWEHQKDNDSIAPWDTLSENRGLPVNTLKEHGIVWDGRRWAIPVRNVKGQIITFRMYDGRKLIGVSTLGTWIWNVSALVDPARRKEKVYQCEGEWDAIALIWFLEKLGLPGVVIACPGANVFKEEWLDSFKGRRVVYCYDADDAGRKGTERAYRLSKGTVRGFEWIHWPETLEEGFDIRDFVRTGGSRKAFEALIEPYTGEVQKAVSEDADDEEEGFSPAENFDPLSSGKRPSFESVLRRYRKWLFLSPDLEDAIRVVFAVVISNQLDGDPLWVHIAGPPGNGKTEAIMTVSGCSHVVTRSTVTAASLVSGFKLPGGVDPSLIPQLFGKTFVLKDFTEVLRLPKPAKDEIYSILRGGYDGRVEKTFGNGIRREYRGYFSIVTGVTQAIYGESGAVLGERFLTFYMPHPLNAESNILAALENVGNETEMKEELSVISREFLEFRVDESDVPSIPREYLLKIVSLAQLVSMLRANVEKDHMRDHLNYRPVFEVGTRLAKQLAKLSLGLALLFNTPKEEIDWKDVYRIVQRTALDSCIGWNMDALQVLAKRDGQTVEEIAKSARIPKSTLRNQLEELTLLGVVIHTDEDNGKGVGRHSYRYWLSDDVRRHWEGSGLKISRLPFSEKPKFKSGGVRLKKRRLRA